VVREGKGGPLLRGKKGAGKSLLVESERMHSANRAVGEKVWSMTGAGRGPSLSWRDFRREKKPYTQKKESICRSDRKEKTIYQG